MSEWVDGTVVAVHTETLGDELAAGVPAATNLLTHPTLLVDAGTITGWTGDNVTVSGPSGAPTVEATDPAVFASLASPSWPVTADQSYAVAVDVGDEPVSVALVFSDGTETEVTSANRVGVTATAVVAGTAWLELRWWPATVAGYGAGDYGEGSYGG